MATKGNLRDTVKSTTEVIDAVKVEIANAQEGKVKIGAVVRLVVLVIAWLNQLAVTFDVYSVPYFSESATYLIATGITIAITVISYWKNNSWTVNAKAADAVLSMLKETGLTSDEVIDAIINVIGVDDEVIENDECEIVDTEDVSDDE